jgi:hypothetical protein
MTRSASKAEVEDVKRRAKKKERRKIGKVEIIKTQVGREEGRAGRRKRVQIERRREWAR